MWSVNDLASGNPLETLYFKPISSSDPDYFSEHPPWQVSNLHPCLIRQHVVHKPRIKSNYARVMPYENPITSFTVNVLVQFFPYDPDAADGATNGGG